MRLFRFRNRADHSEAVNQHQGRRAAHLEHVPQLIRPQCFNRINRSSSLRRNDTGEEGADYEREHRSGKH